MKTNDIREALKLEAYLKFYSEYLFSKTQVKEVVPAGHRKHVPTVHPTPATKRKTK